jgi:hypothetical protein
MTVLQDGVGLEDDALVVATVVHLLRYGRLTWLQTDHALRYEVSGVIGPAVRRLPNC